MTCTKSTCSSPNAIFKIITLLSIALATIIGYLSLLIIYTSFQNESDVESRKLRIEESQGDLEEEIRLNSDELNTILENDLRKQGIHSNKVSNIILVSGYLALAAGCIQFLSSLFVYLNFENKDKDSEQFWSLVSCAVFFCLVSCIILFLCLDTVPYYAQEIIFIIFVTIDMVFSMYSIWLILSHV